MKTTSRVLYAAVAALFSSGAAWAGCDDSHKASWANATEAKAPVVANAPAAQAVKPTAKEQRDSARKVVATTSKKTEPATKAPSEPIAKESLAANARQ